MGLLLSVLVGCVGVLELLACLRHVGNSSIVTINPPTPCLSYHDQDVDVQSTHDSLCSFSHSSDVKLSQGAKRKLENLHEYSLRIRSELRARDKNFDCSTPSDWSIRDYLVESRSCSRPDSRLSPDFNYLVQENEDWDDEDIRKEYENFDDRDQSHDATVDEVGLEDVSKQRSAFLEVKETQKYVRVPTPIPLSLEQEMSRSPSSSDISMSFGNDSGNEVPTTKAFHSPPAILQRENQFFDDGSSFDESDREEEPILRKSIKKSISKSPDALSRSYEKNTQDLSKLKYSKSIESLGNLETEAARLDSPDRPHEDTQTSQRKVTKSSTTILRKPTRLKSRNAEVSKSAENLSGKRSKRHREPERRKSEILQTKREFRDESTNTSPLGTPCLSRTESKKSVSVEVQTSFEEKLDDDEALDEADYPIVGLSESKRDLMSRDRYSRKSFKNRRFPRSSSRENSGDDAKNAGRMTDATAQVDESRGEKARSLRISKFEEAADVDYDRIRDVILDSNGSGTDGRRRSGEDSSRSKSSFDEDEEFVDAIQFSIPDTTNSKAFWLIFSGEYTKAMNKDWHSGHFCCWQCDESLTGQRYVLRDEHPYCIKCYESVFANGCEECNKIIGIDSKDLSYKDKHWHEACFLCNRCRVSLVDKQFGSKVDKIYCGNCYDAQFASRCDGCGEIFRAGTKKMEYKTRQWHEKCFCCVVCKNPIGTKSFIPREQEIYCAGCYEDKFATRCVKCNKIITSGGVTYKNEPWHRDCFTCSNCNNSLAGQRFTSRDDKPYCADCFGELFAKRCTACSKPITGIGGTRFISFEDRHWHNDCFICAGCKGSLVGRGFITDNEDIICPECAKQKLM